MDSWTILFTDIEGSTALFERVGAVFRTALATHNSLLQTEIARHDGRAIGDTGDGLKAAFANAADGIACAIDMQAALQRAVWPVETGALRVRIGVHRGPVEFDGATCHGLTMHHASRVMSAAHGGQILCSPTVEEILPANSVPLRDLGLYRLKGLPEPMRLFQVTEGPFPPPNAPPAFTHRLPVAPTRYFGRETEIAELMEELRPTRGTSTAQVHRRLVTVLGPGGMGKTRFTLEVAARLLPGFSHAVWFVPLAEVRDPALMLEKIRTTLGFSAEPGAEVGGQIGRFLAGQPALLVLDNFEQIMPDGAQSVGALLDAVPSLTCLVSSRVPLDLACEREFRLPALHLPPADSSVTELLEFASVQIFVDRSQAARREFQVTPGNAGDVARLCRALDGIPLALELAAGRAAMLTPTQMLARLTQQLDFLAGGKRDLPERHRTVRAAIAWSYETLAEPLQRLFARLSVFRGGWTIKAADAIAGDGGTVFDGLDELRACSLINARESHAGMRYEMLDVLRAYAGERLASFDEKGAVAARFHAFFFNLVRAGGEIEECERFAQWELEHDNLRALLGGIGPVAERLRAALWLNPFWMNRGNIREGREWLRRLADEARDVPGAPLAEAANGAGLLAWKAGDLDAASALLTDALAQWERAGNERKMAGTLINLGILANERRDYEAASAHYRRALETYGHTANAPERAAVLNNLGDTALRQGDFPNARPALEESLALGRRVAESSALADTLQNLGELHRRLGEFAEARRYLAECLTLRARLRSRDRLPHSALALAEVALAEGRVRGAVALLAAGRHAADASESQLDPTTRAEFDACGQKARALLSAESFSQAWREGPLVCIDKVLTMDGEWAFDLDAKAEPEPSLPP